MTDPSEKLREENARLREEANLREARLLMVASELCADPKINPSDNGDPRWTPALAEARQLRNQLEAARAELARVRSRLEYLCEGWEVSLNPNAEKVRCAALVRTALNPPPPEERKPNLREELKKLGTVIDHLLEGESDCVLVATSCLQEMRVGVSSILASHEREAKRPVTERAAQICESMVVGGRAWTEGQEAAAEALFAAAKAIRALVTAECPECPKYVGKCPACHREKR